jgi:DnaJ-class molecular chaperone
MNGMTCPTCGRLWVCMTGTAANIASLQKCRACRGSGLVKGEPCVRCGGSGVVVVGSCGCGEEEDG